MTAGRYDTVIEQGATFEKNLVYKDANGSSVDLTGYSARMSLKVNKHDTSSVLELTTSNGRITITALTGNIDLLVTAADTEALTPGKYFYDLEIYTSGGYVRRLMQGIITVDKEVTT